MYYTPAPRYAVTFAVSLSKSLPSRPETATFDAAEKYGVDSENCYTRRMSDLPDIVLVALFRETDVLLIDHLQGQKRGSWGLPGGKREADEDMYQAGIRECQEETGLVLRQPFIYLETWVQGLTGEWHAVILGGEVSDQDEDLQSSAEGHPVWVPRQRLPHMPLLPNTLAIIHALFPPSAQPPAADVQQPVSRG